MAGGRSLISSAGDETWSDSEASVTFSKWHSFSFDVETATGPGWGRSARSQVLKVLLSRADARVLPIVSEQTPVRDSLAASQPENQRRNRRTLGRVSSPHWSRPTAGLQEKCNPLIQDQKRNFSNRSPESPVTVRFLMTRSRPRSQVQCESSSGRPRHEPCRWTGGWEWGWAFMGAPRLARRP